jgi:hypothetical protein
MSDFAAVAFVLTTWALVVLIVILLLAWFDG